MQAHTAAHIVGQHQYGRQIGPTEQLHGDSEAIRSGCIDFDMLRDQPCIAGIALAKQLHGPPSRGGRIGAEADGTLVVDEGVAGQEMLPAPRARTQAEVVLLAISPPERIGIEQAKFSQRCTADVHAEADRGGERDAAPSVRGLTGGVQFGHAETECGRTTCDAWIAADRGVVGERRNRRHPRHRIGVAGQPSQPAMRYLGVVVEQHNVVATGRLDADIHRCDETPVASVAQQFDASFLCQIIEPG